MPSLRCVSLMCGAAKPAGMGPPASRTHNRTRLADHATQPWQPACGTRRRRRCWRLRQTSPPYSALRVTWPWPWAAPAPNRSRRPGRMAIRKGFAPQNVSDEIVSTACGCCAGCCVSPDGIGYSRCGARPLPRSWHSAFFRHCRNHSESRDDTTRTGSRGMSSLARRRRWSRSGLLSRDSHGRCCRVRPVGPTVGTAAKLLRGAGRATRR